MSFRLPTATATYRAESEGGRRVLQVSLERNSEQNRRMSRWVRDWLEEREEW